VALFGSPAQSPQKSPDDSQKSPNPYFPPCLVFKQAGQAVPPVSWKNNFSSEVGEMTFQTIKTAVMKFVEDEDGLTIVEYAVAGGLVTLGAVGAFVLLGGSVATAIGCLDDAVNGTAC
jgi:pilus assembly protein Flp/PilA